MACVYCNVLTSKITAEATCDRLSCYPTKNVSSMSLPGWLWRIQFEDRPFRKKIDIFVCDWMNVYGAILAKAMSCLSSPVSAVYAWNAWDHDPPFGEENGCILWLGLSYGSPSNNITDGVSLSASSLIMRAALFWSFKSKSPQESNKIKFSRQGLKTQFRSPFAYS